jgi:hypothetical protein
MKTVRPLNGDWMCLGKHRVAHYYRPSAFDIREYFDLCGQTWTDVTPGPGPAFTKKCKACEKKYKTIEKQLNLYQS